MLEHSRVARLALMIRARAGVTPEQLAGALQDNRSRLREAFGGDVKLRLGVKYSPDPLLLLMGEAGQSTVDAAVEVTAGEDGLDRLFERSTRAFAMLEEIVDPSRTMLMGGVTHRILDPQAGELFLSLTFRRDPKVKAEEFREWWLVRHAPFAVSKLHPPLLAYDQVHVDHAGSAEAAARAGLVYEDYDAYDNLTWASSDLYMASLGDAETQRMLTEDERGFIDSTSYTVGIMRALQESPS